MTVGAEHRMLDEVEALVPNSRIGPEAGPPSEAADAFFESADEVSLSPVPAVVLEVPTERIVAASPSGSLLLEPDGSPVTGRNFEDFTTDGPSGILDLFASGRVTGYAATRLLRRVGQDSLPVSAWLHRFDHQPRSKFALVVFSVPRAVSVLGQVSPESEKLTVMGTTDSSLRIERVSNDASELLGISAAQLLGYPLTALVAEHERSRLLTSVEGAATANRSVTLRLQAADLAAVDRPGPMCQVVLSPLDPPSGCAFVFVAESDAVADAPPTHSPDVAGLLLRLQRAAEVAGIARRVSAAGRDRDVPGLSEISTREWEIVSRLLDGDRVPTIAATLFLSPSTVRSHLAVVYRKLHVTSQQDLIELFRRSRAPDA